MLLYNLGGRGQRKRFVSKRHVDSPPELLNTIYIDDSLDVLHPSLSSRPTGRRWMRSWGNGRHWGLWQIATLSRRRVKPQRPWGIKRMLKVQWKKNPG